MSQYPPPVQPQYPNPAMVQRTSAAAVASLIFGILGCLIITGIIAIITGFIGLGATKNPNVKGRGMAIAGIILGLIGTLGGGACLVAGGGAAIWGYKQIAPAIETTNGFTKAIAQGDAAAAMQFVDSSSVSQAEVENMITQLKSLGQPSDFAPTKMDANADSGVMVVNLGGTLSYPNNVTKTISASLSKQADGTYKVTTLEIK